jgi:hypothetical protein
LWTARISKSLGSGPRLTGMFLSPRVSSDLEGHWFWTLAPRAVQIVAGVMVLWPMPVLFASSAVSPSREEPGN